MSQSRKRFRDLLQPEPEQEPQRGYKPTRDQRAIAYVRRNRNRPVEQLKNDPTFVAHVRYLNIEDQFDWLQPEEEEEGLETAVNPPRSMEQVRQDQIRTIDERTGTLSDIAKNRAELRAQQEEIPDDGGAPAMSQNDIFSLQEDVSRQEMTAAHDTLGYADRATEQFGDTKMGRQAKDDFVGFLENADQLANDYQEAIRVYYGELRKRDVPHDEAMKKATGLAQDDFQDVVGMPWSSFKQKYEKTKGEKIKKRAIVSPYEVN
jgi:hypothetical protein